MDNETNGMKPSHLILHTVVKTTIASIAGAVAANVVNKNYDRFVMKINKPTEIANQA